MNQTMGARQETKASASLKQQILAGQEKVAQDFNHAPNSIRKINIQWEVQLVMMTINPNLLFLSMMKMIKNFQNSMALVMTPD